MSEIKVGGKFVKKDHCVRDELEVVEVSHNDFIANEIIDNKINHITCIWYRDRHGDAHVLTEFDFLDQYKPYEPVYEYLYAYIPYFGEIRTTHNYFENDECFEKHIALKKDSRAFQRLDFTKRERT